MDQASNTPRYRILNLICLGLIVAAIWTLFGKTLGFDFLSWDDDQNVLNNRWLYPGLWWQFWFKPYLCMYLPPVYTAWYALARLDDQPNPLFFHALNVTVHTINSLLVFYVAKNSFLSDQKKASLHYNTELRIRALVAATLAALSFALHPIQVEAVAWVTGLRDLLGAFGLLVATALYIRGPSSLKLSVCSWAAFVFAMLCKPSAVAFPAAILGLVYIEKSYSLTSTLRRLVPWFLSTIPIILVTSSAQTEIADRELAQVNLWQRILVTFDSYAFYLKKWVLPFGLTNDYGRRPAVALGDQNLIANVIITVAAIIALTLLSKKLGRRFLAWCFFSAAMVLPTSGIVTFPFQHTSTVTDHYFYLSIAGFSLALGTAIFSCRSRLVAIAVSFLLVTYSVLDLKQLPRWQNDQQMFPAMVADNPNSYAGYTGMAALAMKDKRRLDALKYLEAAQKIDPNKVDLLANKGLVLNELGRYQDVLTELGRVLPARSIIIDSPVSAPSVSIYYMMIAYAHIRLDQIDQSLPYLCRAKIADPTNKDVIGFMPLVLKQLGHKPFDQEICQGLKAVIEW